jgi:hypothetical protein
MCVALFDHAAIVDPEKDVGELVPVGFLTTREVREKSPGVKTCTRGVRMHHYKEKAPTPFSATSGEDGSITT